MDKDLDVQPDSEDAVTPRELAELIKDVPNPMVDSRRFLMDPDPGKAAREYVDRIKNKPGGVVIILSNLSRNARETQRCGDCPEHLTGGDLFLVGADNPNDVSFGSEAALNMGFLTPAIKPENQCQGAITMIRMTPMSIHQLEKHNNFDTRRYSNGLKIDPKQVLSVLRPSVVAPAPNSLK